MVFHLDPAMTALRRTPEILDAWLRGIPEELALANEGADSFSPYDIVGHLVHGERTDWMPRVRLILEHGSTRAFEPFDRFAMRRESAGQPIADRLDEFAALRSANLDRLAALELGADDLQRTGRHPELGIVTLQQLLATWVVHDLDHLGQLARVLAKQHQDDVGPWMAYLPILGQRP
jgi:hypothetical protein